MIEPISTKALLSLSLIMCLVLSSCNSDAFRDFITGKYRLSEDYAMLTTDNTRYTIESDNLDEYSGIHEYIIAHLVTDQSIYAIQMDATDGRDVMDIVQDMTTEDIICNYYRINLVDHAIKLYPTSVEWLESIMSELPQFIPDTQLNTTTSKEKYQYCRRIVFESS